MSNLEIIHQHLTIMYTAIGVMLTYVIGSENTPLLLCLIYLILIPISSKINQLNESNAAISAYMTVFLEPYLEGIKWETHRSQKVNLSNKVSVKEYQHLRPNPLLNIFLYRPTANNFIVGIVVYLIYIYLISTRDISNSIIIGAVMNSISIVILSYFLKRDLKISDVRKMHKHYWEALKNDPDAQNDTSLLTPPPNQKSLQRYF